GSTQHLPEVWERTDEWYNLKDIQPEINVLLNLDETSYEGGTNGDSHPITWYRDFDGGRSWYTGFGHTEETFAEPAFLELLWGGIEYAAGPGVPVNYDNASVAPEENRFRKIVLDFNLNEPMELDILPNGDILFVERQGEIKLFKQSTEKTEVVTTLEVFSELEDGLLGLALDPNYKENNWIYLYYSPAGEAPIQHLSRFVFAEDSLHRASEKILLTVDTQREECCHSAGSIEFGPDGLLYLSTGDNTSPRATGYGPIDEGIGRKYWDAQRTSANTQDLRGKILRIQPENDGTYSIPKGNLFADASDGRPEIYIMGARNPFRISIDQKTGYLYWGDVGPDAGKDSVGLGSRGYDEVNQAREAGNYGWPYFIGANFAYNDYDYTTNQTGDLYDAKKPINRSPNNSGAEELPPANPAMIYYPYAVSPDFPAVGQGGRNAMAGPTFYTDLYPDSESRYPGYYDGKLFTYDWMRGWVMAVTLDDNGEFVRMERFLPNMTFNNLMDLTMGADGDLWALEYGTNWFTQNMDARLIHIAYSSGNRVPTAIASADQPIGALPLDIQFSSAESIDPDGDDLLYNWTFGDGTTSTEANPTYSYTKAGDYEVELTVTDPDGETSSSKLLIMAGNELPVVDIRFAGNTQFFWGGGDFDYEVTVSDGEDGSIGQGIDPSAVTFSADYLARGHDVTEVLQGHEANIEASAHLVGKALVEGSDCMACHQINSISVGPSYTMIAERYAGDESALEGLISNVIGGSTGVWGDLVMSPHPQLSRQDTEKMMRYILSFSDESSDTGLPTRGAFALDQHKSGEKEGTYIFIASYTDRGGPGAKALTARKVVELSYPIVPAADFTEKSKAMTFNVTGEQWPGLEEEIMMVLPSHESEVRYASMDLTEVGQLKVQIAVAPTYFSGGTMEVYLDNTEGSPIGSVSFEPGLTEFGFKDLLINLEPTTGINDLVFKFSCKDEDKMFAGISSIEFIPNNQPRS
ncbi:MAG: PQQ-dependent sugar dehydrogenase, partial [Bacteroidota bacterium]